MSVKVRKGRLTTFSEILFGISSLGLELSSKPPFLAGTEPLPSAAVYGQHWPRLVICLIAVNVCFPAETRP